MEQKRCEPSEFCKAEIHCTPLVKTPCQLPGKHPRECTHALEAERFRRDARIAMRRAVRANPGDGGKVVMDAMHELQNVGYPRNPTMSKILLTMLQREWLFPTIDE